MAKEFTLGVAYWKNTPHNTVRLFVRSILFNNMHRSGYDRGSAIGELLDDTSLWNGRDWSGEINGHEYIGWEFPIEDRLFIDKIVRHLNKKL